MSSNQTQNQQQPGQDNNASPGQQRADHAPDMKPPAAEPGSDGAAPGRGDSNRTPWQGQQPVGEPRPQQQGNAVGRKQQQQGSPSEDTDDAGDTRPNTDDGHASGNN
jgi:hypothetical protein